MIDRKGKVLAKVVKNTICEVLTPETIQHVKDAIIYTDEWWEYNSMRQLFKHQDVHH